MTSTASTTYKDKIEGKLLVAIVTGTTTGVTVKIKQRNGVTPTWPTTAHRIMVTQRTALIEKTEKIEVASGTTQSGQTVTLGTLTRALTLEDGTNFTGSVGTAQSFSAGADVQFVIDSNIPAMAAMKDLANTFTDHQTIAVNKELRLADSASAIWDDGSDINFKSSAQATRTLAQLASLSGSNDKVKISSNDTTEGYLNGKLVAGAGITLTENNDAGNETLSVIAANTVATGHTGLSTVTTGGILIGNGTGNMTIIGPGTTGQVPVSNGTTIAMSLLVPIGGLMLWSTDSAPTGWLLCYGQAVSRSTYSALFAVVSTVFGVGDGSTTFNLPDMRGRFPLGQDDMGGSSANHVTDAAADTIGSTGGTDDGTHLHVVDPNNTAINRSGGGGNSYGWDADTGGNSNNTSVMPPYQTFNYIIYAAA